MGSKACQGLSPNITFKSPRQTVRPTPTYRCSLCAWHTLEKPSWPSLPQASWQILIPRPRSTGAAMANPNPASPVTVRRRPSPGSYGSQSHDPGCCSWAGHSAAARSPGLLPSAVTAALRSRQQQTASAPWKLPRLPEPAGDRYGRLTISMTKALSSEIFILCWKSVKWALEILTGNINRVQLRCILKRETSETKAKLDFT